MLDLQAPSAFTPPSRRHPRTNPLHRRLVLHLAPAPRTRNWCGESILLRAGPSKPCSSACFFNSFAPSPQKIKRMRFRRSMYIYGLFRSVLEVTRYSCTCVGVKRFQSLPQTIDDAFSSRTAAYPVVSLTRGFDSLANGVPPSKVDEGVKSRIACQVRGEQVGAVSVPGFCVPRTAPATVPTQLFPTTDVRWDIRDGRE